MAVSTMTLATDINRVKIVVLGESGSGKTSLVHLFCNDKPVTNPSWTIGCSVDVKLHEYKAGTPEEKTYFIELWDIGGSRSHANSRRIFYQSVNGIILVHDLSNRKSQDNLRQWLSEILNNHSIKRAASSHLLFDEENYASEKQTPILVIGTKLDQAAPGKEACSGTSLIAQECSAEEINLDCRQPKYLAAGTTNALKITRFFDKVIEKQFYSKPGINLGTSLDRRRRKLIE